MLPKEELLKRVENREEVAKILDKAEKALKTWELVITDFVSPAVLAEIERLFSNLTEVKLISWGGYATAERQRIGIFRQEMEADINQIPLVALDIAGNFLFDTATHRDFLGAILATGIVRDKVGDIIVLGERGAQVIVTPEIAEFLETSLTRVRSVPVTVSRIELSQLKVSPPKTKTMTTVEASCRLDAVASFGFGISRSKMASAIVNGDVRVNWKEVTQPSYNLRVGDLVSFRGKGRLQIDNIEVTKRERYRISLTRFV
ncbi:MAG: photosystem II S4 domain protein [Geminocystis sp.]|nr:photosystem II S4 domain protein [Geminocystis sp.]HIK36856.1 photosystem II S4 domain protein [Geminocystis sp. M7585_C2015_104]MCS7148032.1 photosystem II S4 domain protein [Geminocystis sp.]MCX8077776.1 photosystem II S4 domain protein [Geminocystis sp.]MDW8116384.1 photosystem II S4 domain protein [Geminocystis sp.]